MESTHSHWLSQTHRPATTVLLYPIQRSQDQFFMRVAALVYVSAVRASFAFPPEPRSDRTGPPMHTLAHVMHLGTNQLHYFHSSASSASPQSQQPKRDNFACEFKSGVQQNDLARSSAIQLDTYDRHILA